MADGPSSPPSRDKDGPIPPKDPSNAAPPVIPFDDLVRNRLLSPLQRWRGGKMPLLINYTNNDAPFIAPFTWGECGLFPGVGSKHGNLLTSFLVIGPKEQG